MHALIGIIVAQEKAPEQNGKQAQGFDPSFFVLMALIFGAFYFIVLRPAKQREKKEREDLFGKLKKNDEVLTASGIIGIVAIIKDDEVVLKVDESSNVRLRVLKSAIVRVLNAKDSGKDVSEKAGTESQSPDHVKAGNPPSK